MKIRIEHAACRKSFNHAQLLNPEQYQRRPDVIEELNCNEQNPQWDFVSLCSAGESNTVMSDKHFSTNCMAFVPNANARRFRFDVTESFVVAD
jgi:hypothetical protein